MNAKQNIQHQKSKKVVSQKANAPKQKGVFKNESFPLGKQNYILMAIGFAITVIGYILMVGTENIYSFGNTTLPVIFKKIGLSDFCESRPREEYWKLLLNEALNVTNN